MIDKKKLLNDFENVYNNLKSKDFNQLDLLLELKTKIKALNCLIFENETNLKNKNIISKQIAKNIKEKVNAQELKIKIFDLKELKTKINSNNKAILELKNEINNKMLLIPNLVDINAPYFEKKEQFLEIFRSKHLLKKINLSHKDLGIKANLIEFKKASNISGSKFCIYLNKGSYLKRALIDFMLDTHKKKYQELSLPYLVKNKSMFNSGQYPKFKFDSYQILNEELSLIPTSEVSLLSFYANKIFKSEKSLPKSFCSFSACFRKEAGALGKTTSGLFRMHQFFKVELFKFCTPKNSNQEFDNIVNDASKILQLLNLPYRIISLNRKDLGFSASKTFDLEVYSPFLKQYVEVSSISNCSDFQARRAKIRYKDENGNINFVHTLNGSGLAIDRIFALILENYYDENKKEIIIPQVLIKYLNFEKIKLEK